MPKTNKPIEKVRYGNVTISIWENETEDQEGKKRTNYSVSLQKSYKDAKGEWQNSNTFFVNEIPKAIEGLRDAFKLIHNFAKE